MLDWLLVSETLPHRYPEQESEEIGHDIIARLNPGTNAIENLEVLFFSTRLLRNDIFELPILANFRQNSAMHA